MSYPHNTGPQRHQQYPPPQQFGQQPQQSWDQGYSAPADQGWNDQYSPHVSPQPPRRQAPPPAPKKKKWPFVLAGVAAVLVLGSALNSGKSSTPTVGVAPSGSSAQQPAVSAPVQDAADITNIIYEVKVQGGGSASVSYMTKSGVSQENSAKTPWTKKVDGGFLGGSLVGQKKSGGDGQITCTVKDSSGKILAENVSSGPYAVCTSAGW